MTLTQKKSLRTVRYGRSGKRTKVEKVEIMLSKTNFPAAILQAAGSGTRNTYRHLIYVDATGINGQS